MNLSFNSLLNLAHQAALLDRYLWYPIIILSCFVTGYILYLFYLLPPPHRYAQPIDKTPSSNLI